MADDEVDYAVAAYRDADGWQVDEMKASLGYDLEKLSEALARFPSEVGVLGMVSVNEDFFVLVRRETTGVRMMLSDVTAVGESQIAADVADLLDVPEVDEDDDPQPGGDLELLADLGISAVDLRELCEDDDLLPDDVLLDLADRLGFADDLEDLIGE